MEDCLHDNKELRARVVRNGATQYVEQCLTCGASMNQPMSHAKVIAMKLNPPAFDEGLAGRYNLARTAEILENRTRRDMSFQAGYGQYLRTSAWASKRAAVLKRCGGVCEGCGNVAATEVHHLTYDNVGDELLFQLVGVCRGCHQKAHDPKLPEWAGDDF